MNDAERKNKIEEMQERLKSVPATVQLARIRHFMTHCDRCDADLGEPIACFCPKCGYETFM